MGAAEPHLGVGPTHRSWSLCAALMRLNSAGRGLLLTLTLLGTQRSRSARDPGPLLTVGLPTGPRAAHLPGEPVPRDTSTWRAARRARKPEPGANT